MAKFIVFGSDSYNSLINVLVNLDLDKRWEVTVAEAGSARSRAQNSLYWKWMTSIAEQFNVKHKANHNKDHMDEYFKMQFLPYTRDKIGEHIIEVKTSTRGLGMKKFTTYLNEIEVFAIESGYTLPFPEDLYAEAMGKS